MHADVRAQPDLISDPDALDNVCTPGAPPWVNEYYARWQKYVYRGLLRSIPLPGPSSSALEVGCGAGRWCRILAERGYTVTGIDLQPSLIEALRVRHPEMTFECVPAQEFSPATGFDLVSSVTVIAHNPPDEQERIVRHLRSLLSAGGHAIVLENVRDQGRHVFARSVDGWVGLFEEARLELITHRRYDFSPALRSVNRALAAARGTSDGRPQGPGDPSTHMTRPDAHSSPRVRQAVGWARRIATALDSRLEPELIRRSPRGSSVHCGFVFRAT